MISNRAVLSLVVTVSSLASAQELSPEAQQIVTQLQKKAAAIYDKADAELRPAQDEAIAKLRSLQDAACKAAKLDDALAIREEIRRIMGLQPDPGPLHLTEQDIGKTMIFDVVGRTEGAVWGSEVFTGDSHLAAAAVHSGVLKPGQRGAVRVRVIGGQKSYAGSVKNGVETAEYGPWSVSFTVAPGPSLPK